MGWFDDLTDVVSDTLDVGVGIVTFGEYGDISQEKVSSLIAAGMTVAAASEAFGVAESVIEEMLEE